VTVYPLACNNLANDADMMPFPSDDVTPPVTKIYLVGKVLIATLFNKVRFVICCLTKVLLFSLIHFNKNETNEQFFVNYETSSIFNNSFIIANSIMNNQMVGEQLPPLWGGWRGFIDKYNK